MKVILSIVILALAVSMIMGHPKNYKPRQRRNMPKPAELPMEMMNDDQNGLFPMGAQVLMKFPMGPPQPKKRIMTPEDNMPNNNAVVTFLGQPRGNLFNLSSYLTTNNPGGTAMTFVPLVTLLSGMFGQG